jgi:hypothetical protein
VFSGGLDYFPVDDEWVLTRASALLVKVDRLGFRLYPKLTNPIIDFSYLVAYKAWELVVWRSFSTAPFLLERLDGPTENDGSAVFVNELRTNAGCRHSHIESSQNCLELQLEGIPPPR